jgi:hypothetical protein
MQTDKFRLTNKSVSNNAFKECSIPCTCVVRHGFSLLLGITVAFVMDWNDMLPGDLDACCF